MIIGKIIKKILFCFSKWSRRRETLREIRVISKDLVHKTVILKDRDVGFFSNYFQVLSTSLVCQHNKSVARPRKSGREASVLKKAVIDY